MLAKLLGIIDFWAGTTLLFYPYFPESFIMYATIFLILKGCLFASSGNVISYVDIFLGAYLILMGWGLTHVYITAFGVIFLYQKGIFSMF